MIYFVVLFIGAKRIALLHPIENPYIHDSPFSIFKSVKTEKRGLNGKFSFIPLLNNNFAN
jgi:hypothetical protein